MSVGVVAGDPPLTNEQRAVVESRPVVGDVVSVVAVAGAGKTTTIIEWSKRLVVEGPVLYIAFNREIVNEAQTRFSGVDNVRVTTFSALAHASCVDNGFDVVFEQDIDIDAELGTHATALQRQHPRERTEAIAMLRNYCYSGDAQIDGHTHGSYFVNNSNRGRIMAGARQIIAAIGAKRCRCPFWAAEKMFSLDCPRLDHRYIIVDEAQDLNGNMIDVILRQRDHASIIVVGDPYQQIYGFRGTVNAFNRIETTHSHRLTHSHRWGYQVGAATTALLHGLSTKPPPYRIFGRTALNGGDTPIAFVPATTYKDGTCPCALWTSSLSPTRRCPDDVAIVARSNRGVLQAAAAVAKCPRRSHHALCFYDYDALNTEMTTMLAKFERGPQAFLSNDPALLATLGLRPRPTNRWGKQQMSPIESFIGRHTTESRAVWNCISELAQRGQAADQGHEALMRACGLWAGDDEATRSPRPLNAVPEPFVIRLTTTHRCKGLEFKHVWLWNDFYLPKQPSAERDEEVNIAYVAMTRTQQSLVLPALLRRAVGMETKRPTAKKRSTPSRPIRGQKSLAAILEKGRNPPPPPPKRVVSKYFQQQILNKPS